MMRLIKIVDKDGIKIYLNPRFVKSVSVYADPELMIIEMDTESRIATYDRESMKRLGQMFGLA